MRFSRLVPAALVAVALAAGTTGTATANPPVRLGPVTNLKATVTKPGAAYAVAATWDALAGATSYNASISMGGTRLAAATVSTNSWTASVTSGPGTVTLTVTPVGRHATSASITVTLPDITAPTGTYTTTWNDAGDATLTQVALSDDSPVSQVKRVVTWGDTSAPQTWTGTGTTLAHHYPGVGRYVPSVTLSDAAGNTAVIAVPAVVVGDHAAPTGSFGVTTGSAWATLTPVQITQNALADNFSPADDIVRSVNWADGSAAENWPAGATLSHVYSAAGTFAPVVTLTDEAHNTSTVTASAVTVRADTVAPVTTLLLPRHAKQSVRSWRTLVGKTTDIGGTGVKVVTLNAVEKRHGTWFGYRPGTKTWLKAGTKAKAFARSRAFVLTPDGRHRWAATVKGLTRGTLVYRVHAFDLVGNRGSAGHKALLTKR